MLYFHQLTLILTYLLPVVLFIFFVFLFIKDKKDNKQVLIHSASKTESLNAKDLVS